MDGPLDHHPHQVDTLLVEYYQLMGRLLRLQTLGKHLVGSNLLLFNHPLIVRRHCQIFRGAILHHQFQLANLPHHHREGFLQVAILHLLFPLMGRILVLHRENSLQEAIL